MTIEDEDNMSQSDTDTLGDSVNEAPWSPTEKRAEELLEIWQDEIQPYADHVIRDPGEITSWDDLIECDEEPLMTASEFRWCQKYFRVRVTATVNMVSDMEAIGLFS